MANVNLTYDWFGLLKLNTKVGSPWFTQLYPTGIGTYSLLFYIFSLGMFFCSDPNSMLCSNFIFHFADTHHNYIIAASLTCNVQR